MYRRSIRSSRGMTPKNKKTLRIVFLKVLTSRHGRPKLFPRRERGCKGRDVGCRVCDRPRRFAPHERMYWLGTYHVRFRYVCGFSSTLAFGLFRNHTGTHHNPLRVPESRNGLHTSLSGRSKVPFWRGQSSGRSRRQRLLRHLRVVSPARCFFYRPVVSKRSLGTTGARVKR